MGYFFNGRLWITPAVMSVVNDGAMYNQGQGIANVAAILGSSTGGQPNVALRFGSPEQAIATLVSGPLLDGVTRAFNPSDETGGPSEVVAIRVNPAVQATLSLLDASTNDVIDLTSVDYGQRTNQIKVSVAAASVQGVLMTTQLGQQYYTQDNIYNSPFTIQYSGGQASATMAISNTAQTLTLDAPAGTPVATISLATYATTQQLVDYINTITGFAATVNGGNTAWPTLNGLDTLAAHDVKTAPYAATSILQAAVNWLNSVGEGYVVAVRHANAGLPPAVIGFTYLSGGTDGTITNTNWTNAFSVLQSQSDVKWITPMTGTAAIISMADAHVQYMSTTMQQERRAICGMAVGSTDAQAIAEAYAINSDRTSLVHIGMYDFNAAGVLTLYDPFYTAAMIAGAFSGVNPGVALTNTSLRVQGLERTLLIPVNTDALISGGVLPVAPTPTGFNVIQSISTWLVNANYNRVEQSVGAALDYTAATVRAALATIKGAPGSPVTLGQAVTVTETALRGLAAPPPGGLGVLVGNTESPPYLGITATLVGNVIAVQFQASPVIPVNYVPVTINAVPFTGTATASASS